MHTGMAHREQRSGGYSVEHPPVVLGAAFVPSDHKNRNTGYGSAQNEQQVPDAGPEMGLDAAGCFAVSPSCKDSGAGQPLKGMVHRKCSMNQNAEKRLSADLFMKTGEFIHAWDLYDQIGDVDKRQQALAQARSTKREGTQRPRTASTDASGHVLGADGYQAGSPTSARSDAQSCPSTPQSWCPASTGSLRQTPETPSSRRPFSAQSEARRPLSAGSQTSPAISCNPELPKKLRTALGVNRRKTDEVKQLFGTWNKDRSGVMSRCEFGDGVRSTLPHASDEEIDREFRAAGLDCNDFIVEHTFVKWLLHT